MAAYGMLNGLVLGDGDAAHTAGSMQPWTLFLNIVEKN